MMRVNENEVEKLEERIKNGTALYYYRATPFSEHGEFNYNGALKDDFFFKNMFSSQGKCNEYISQIKKGLKNDRYKSIVLIGNQGCGKSTFVHKLETECSEYKFQFFDFDKDLSNTSLSEYIEKMSYYLLELLKSDEGKKQVNAVFYNLFYTNRGLLERKINAGNKITEFFLKFKEVFIDRGNDTVEQGEFINTINDLFFNQILSLIILWYLSEFKIKFENNEEVKKIVFCLDNLDVLVNEEIVNKFFKEYIIFVRNIDSIIQNLSGIFLEKGNITYNTLFVFIFCCRQNTWARVREHYRQNNAFLQISSKEINITDAFEKREILKRREKYIIKHANYYGELKDNITKARIVLSDMDKTEQYNHNIYDLFNDDYRQCTITFEEILEKNPNLFDEYIKIKNKMGNSNKFLYGARGIIYKALFDKFKEKGIFNAIGVLEINATRPLVSNARMILNYLNHYKNTQPYIAFEEIVDAFDGIIGKEQINNSLRAMFRLGDDSQWNELIIFNEINSETIMDCSGMEIRITKAGHEYLSLIATHFEFFNIRVKRKRTTNIPLFSEQSMEKSKNSSYEYNFQETISLVLEIVEKCSKRMSTYYDTIMKKAYSSKEEYLDSPYVYYESGVLHGERIIHTHIRYIDTYRLFILSQIANKQERKKVNEILVKYIEKYIQIGETYPDILTNKSTEELFPDFKEKIELIRGSEFEDCKTAINI